MYQKSIEEVPGWKEKRIKERERERERRCKCVHLLALKDHQSGGVEGIYVPMYIDLSIHCATYSIRLFLFLLFGNFKKKKEDNNPCLLQWLYVCRYFYARVDACLPVRLSPLPLPSLFLHKPSIRNEVMLAHTDTRTQNKQKKNRTMGR